MIQRKHKGSSRDGSFCFTASQGEPIYYIAQLQDITDRIRAEEALRQSKLEAEKARELAESLANTDYLTGVLNRRAFMERFRIEFERSKRSNGLMSLILTDLDYFKKVNDTYGHLAGDLVLQKFTETILCSCRPYDFVGRFGGEELSIQLALPQALGWLLSLLQRRIILTY